MKAGATGRRKVVFWGAAAGLGLVAAGCGERREARAPKNQGQKTDEDGISPAEDLMREHGVLNRILLVYEECARRIESPGGAPALDVLGDASDIVRGFIEDYHEKLEEDFLFPRFERAGKQVILVETLRRQHRAGRRLTDQIRSLGSLATAEHAIANSLSAVMEVKGSTFPLLSGAEDREMRRSLLEAIRAFVRLYRPHEAREDTELFPAMRAILRPAEIDALGERFEDRERELFGKEGFEGVVEQVGRLEQRLGIHDLDMFTPPDAPDPH